MIKKDDRSNARSAERVSTSRLTGGRNAAARATADGITSASRSTFKASACSVRGDRSPVAESRDANHSSRPTVETDWPSRRTRSKEEDERRREARRGRLERLDGSEDVQEDHDHRRGDHVRERLSEPEDECHKEDREYALRLRTHACWRGESDTPEEGKEATENAELRRPRPESLETSALAYSVYHYESLLSGRARIGRVPENLALISGCSDRESRAGGGDCGVAAKRRRRPSRDHSAPR